MQMTLGLNIVNNIDYTLYLVTDHASQHSVIAQTKSALSGGATLVQYRAKEFESAKLYEEASAVLELVHAARRPLIINDRVDIALAVNADGVHLGPEDLPISVARRIMGPAAIIGASVSTIEDAIEAELEGASYLGIGAIYDTNTKLDAGAGIGPEILADIKSAINIPIIGIGGINLSNVSEVIKNGADGVAVVSAITRAKNVTIATKNFMTEIKLARI